MRRVVALISLCMIAFALEDTFARAVAVSADAWRPLPPVRRSEWVEANLRLPAEFSAHPGSYDLVDRPFFREIIDAVDDPRITEIALSLVPQIGKTTLLYAIAASQGEVDAAPMMFAGPDLPYCREQRDVLYRICEVSPALKSRIPPARLRNDRWIDLDRCYVYLAWSGSKQRLSGRSCKIVLCSEVDKWQHSLELAKQRTAAFYRYCRIYESAPDGASPWIWPLYKESDRRTFRVPCPHCGEHQELRFFMHKAGPYIGRGGVAGLQDEHGRWRTAMDARDHAHYICERNGCRIESAEKREMVRRGKWAPEGCEIDKAGNLTGEPKTRGRRAGYHLNRLYAPTVSFGDAAEAYLQLRDTEQGRQSFFNDWLGLPWEPRGSTPRWKDLGVRLAGEHPRGTVPRGAYFLTAAADVQADRVYWVVRAWGEGKTSWLVDYGCLKRLAAELDRAAEEGGVEIAEAAIASDLAQLDAAILDHRWIVDGENPLGMSALAVRLLGIDRGYRPTDVDAFLRSHPGDRARAVFGDPKISPGSLYRPTRVGRDPETGKKLPDEESIDAWGIDTNAYKTEIADRWTADRKLPGVWWLPRNILEQEDGENYLRQITAETRRFESERGRKRIRWELISHGLDNHYWDAEVYCACLADMVAGNTWDAARWPWVRMAAARKRTDAPAAEAAVVRDHYHDDFAAR